METKTVTCCLVLLLLSSSAIPNHPQKPFLVLVGTIIAGENCSAHSEGCVGAGWWDTRIWSCTVGTQPGKCTRVMETPEENRKKHSKSQMRGLPTFTVRDTSTGCPPYSRHNGYVCSRNGMTPQDWTGATAQGGSWGLCLEVTHPSQDCRERHQS